MTSLKKIVLFDIDRTIFDTAKFVEAISLRICKVMGIDLEILSRVKQEYIASLSADREFDPEKFTRLLCEKFNFKNQDLLLNVFYDDGYSEFVFPETFVIFEKLKECRLGVFSEGTSKFQNHKFNSLGLTKYLDKNLIFIFDHKTNQEAIDKIPSEAIVIDDKESVCQYLFENGIETIWLNKKNEDDSKNFRTIHSLLELPSKLV